MPVWPFRRRSEPDVYVVRGGQIVRIGEGRAATLSNPPDWLIQALGGSETYSGKAVTPENAASIVPVFSAVSLVAGSVATLPLKVYRQTQDGPLEATSSRQWKLLHDEPNPEVSSDEYLEIVTAHLLLWGNHYSAKVRDPLGIVNELWPISPARVTPFRKDGQKRYLIDGREWTDHDVLHIRGLGYDGVIGLSPIAQAKQMLGNTLALEEFQGRFWANGAWFGGFLRHPSTLSDEANERLTQAFRAKHAGVSNAGKIVVLEEDLQWQQAGMPLEDAQFIDTAKLSDLRVAQLFRVPPYMLGASSGDSMTYKTIESQSIDFVRWSLMRWLRRIERSLRRDRALFPLQGPVLFPEFLLEGLLRGDTLDRFKAYELGIRNHFVLPNEARRKENMRPLDDGDEFPVGVAEPSPLADAENGEEDSPGR